MADRRVLSVFVFGPKMFMCSAEGKGASMSVSLTSAKPGYRFGLVKRGEWTRGGQYGKNIISRLFMARS